MPGFTTRIAPSPTGLFHLGTARTAYFNWLVAKASGGKFILRIDDTDAARNDEAFVKVILDGMDYLGLKPDALYRQSQRSEIYASYLDKLKTNGAVWEDNGCWRLRLPANMPMTWKDAIKGDIKVTDNDRDLISQLVVQRSDGSPTYHFASIIDDLDLGVDFVIRGVDHISNTPKQLAILVALGIDVSEMTFAHLGLIEIINAEKQRKKLSKRDGAASLLNFRDAGVTPEAMLNFMLRLGWSARAGDFDKTHPLVTKDEAAKIFLSDGTMKSSPVLFDQAKLDWYDKKYKMKAAA